MKRQKFIFLALLTASTVLLTSCWDRKEINDLAFVIATGFDKGSEGGTYQSSVQVPLISAMGGAGSSGGGGGTSGESPYFVDGAEGANVRESHMKLQQRMSRRLYFAHRRVVVIGEDLAKEGMQEILNTILIEPQSRLSTFLIMSKGKAVDILNTPARFEKLTGEAIREMAKNSIGANVNDVLQELESPGLEPVIPIIEKEKPQVKTGTESEILMSRFAVLKDDKVVFTTNDEESAGVIWIRNQSRDKNITFSYKDEGELSIRIIQGNIRKNMKMVRGRPAFTLTVNTTGMLMENEPNVSLEDAETYQKVIQEFEKVVKKQITALLKHAHQEGSDVAGFGYYLYRNHHQDWKKEWEKDWQKRLKDLEVTVNVDGEIQRVNNTGHKMKE